MANFAYFSLILSRLGVDTAAVESSRLLKYASASGVIQAIGIFLSVIVNIILARALGADGLGKYASAFALVSFLAIVASAGVPRALVYLLPNFKVNNEYALINGAIRWGYIHVTLASLALGFIFYFFLQTPIFSDYETINVYIISIFILPLLSIGLLQEGIIKGREHILASQLPQLLIRPGFFSLSIIYLHLTFSSPSSLTAVHAVYAQILAALVTVLFGFYLVRRRMDSYTRNAGHAYQLKIWYVKSSLLTVNQICAAAMMSCGLIILPIFVESAEVGLFRIAMTVAALTTFSLKAINGPLPPVIARLYANGQLAQLQKIITNSTRMAMWLALPVAAVFLLAGIFIINILFGPGFDDAYPLLAVLTLGQLANVGAGSVGFILQMTGRERYAAHGVLVAAVCQIALTFALVPLIGAMGAACAHVMGILIWNFLLIRSVVLQLKLDPTFLGCIARP